MSLGPSNDDSDAVRVEIRAAELDAWYIADDLSVSTKDGWCEFEIDGWRAHCSGGDLVGPLANQIRQDFDAGWLACEMTMHEVHDERDAETWAWDISRPLAEQFAETAADDAAADALVFVPGIEIVGDGSDGDGSDGEP